MVTKPFTNPGVLGVIKEEHEEVKGLFNDLTGVVEYDKNRARAVIDEILTNLEVHTKLEEDIVYPRLREQDQRLFYEAKEEHHVAEVLIHEIRQMNVEDPAFSAKTQVLRTNVEHHMAEEEDDMFDRLKKLSNETLDQMAVEWRSMKPQKMEMVKH
jgi:hemerythrin superfamily protein